VPAPAQAVAFDAGMHYLLPRGAVVLLTINNTLRREIPVRADGHTFVVLSTSERPGAEAAFASAWLRRDVVSVPALGWARLAFAADSPGVWRLSAAGAFHVANGAAVELFEAMDALAGLDVPADHRRVCGMPAPSAAPRGSPSPSPSPGAGFTGIQQLSGGALMGTIAGPMCAAALVAAAAVMRLQWLRDHGGGGLRLSKVAPTSHA
jgi:hypothetical protein